MAKRLELDRAINDRLGLLKVHLPYHESDHVLNIADNPTQKTATKYRTTGVGRGESTYQRVDGQGVGVQWNVRQEREELLIAPTPARKNRTANNASASS